MRNNISQLLANLKWKAKYVDVWIDADYQWIYSLCHKPLGIECYESMDQTRIVTRDDDLNNHFTINFKITLIMKRFGRKIAIPIIP